MSTDIAMHREDKNTLAGRQVEIRKAMPADVGQMYQIINQYAEKQIMLPKTHLQLYEFLRDYSVATETKTGGSVLGCGALHFYWENLAEIRAVAVSSNIARKGVGTMIVEGLVAEARQYHVEQIFVFTYAPKFFSRFGFIQVEHGTMPLKVYNECFHCPKFNTCDELAMVLHL